jgi:hypothetical protein
MSITWKKVIKQSIILFSLIGLVIFAALFPWLAPRGYTPFTDDYQSGYNAGTVYDNSRYIEIWDDKFDFRHPWMSFEQWAYCIGFENGAKTIDW